MRERLANRSVRREQQMAEAPKDSLPNVKALLARWDATTNPIFLAAAGQLRQALRSDGQGETAEAATR